MVAAPAVTYPTDLTDREWALLEPLLPPAKPGGRPRSVQLRVILNGIFYVLRSGCQWRLLPRTYGPFPGPRSMPTIVRGVSKAFGSGFTRSRGSVCGGRAGASRRPALPSAAISCHQLPSWTVSRSRPLNAAACMATMEPRSSPDASGISSSTRSVWSSGCWSTQLTSQTVRARRGCCVTSSRTCHDFNSSGPTVPTWDRCKRGSGRPWAGGSRWSGARVVGVGAGRGRWAWAAGRSGAASPPVRRAARAPSLDRGAHVRRDWTQPPDEPRL